MTSYTDLKQDDLPDPSALLADKGYDSDAIRADLEKRGVDPVIPTKSNRKIQRAISKTTCAMRNRIERFFNKIKHSRRVAPRCDQQPISFLGFVSLATIKVWIQSDDVAQSVLLVRGFPGGSAVTAARWPPGR